MHEWLIALRIIISKMRVNNGHVVLKMQGFLISKRKKKLYYCSHAIILDSKARLLATFWITLYGYLRKPFSFFVSSVLSFGYFNIEDPQRCFKTSRLQLVRISFVSVVKLRKATSWRVWSNQIVIYSHLISCSWWRHKTGFFKWRIFAH